MLRRTRKGGAARLAQHLYANMKGKALSRNMTERAAKVCNVIRKRVNCRLYNCCAQQTGVRRMDGSNCLILQGLSKREGDMSTPGVRPVRPYCCVEAECHFCYLRDSGVYVHESCCPGNQRHPLTYVGRRRFWYGPMTK